MGFLDAMQDFAEECERQARADKIKVEANVTVKKLDDELLNYVVLENQNIEKLEEFVTIAIRKGWIPAGNISSIPSTGGALFQQAVYRNAKK